MLVERIEKEGLVTCLYKSSNILASTYDQNKKELNITFNAGRRYTYYGVEHKDYVRFEISESQGQIFNKHIKKYITKKNEDIDPSSLLEKVSNLITN